MNVQSQGGTDPPQASHRGQGDKPSKDVARRPLDQAGFRILNLGDPERPDDATKTDNRSTPKPTSRSGSPGKSLLAAPADHSHPASSDQDFGEVQVSDATEQSATGKKEQVVAEFLVNFQPIKTKLMQVNLSAMVRATEGKADFAVRLGGSSGEPDGKHLVLVQANSRDFASKGAGAGDFETPGGTELVKITALTERANATAHIRAKNIRFQGVTDGE